jgi:hypothetical protein
MFSSISSCHHQTISDPLERYLGDDALPVPQSQFNHLRIERAEVEAEARMQAILEGFDL